MKKAMWLMLGGIVFISACESKHEKVQAFVPGTYVNHVTGELSVADDTLQFTLLDGDHYAIIRRTGFNAIRNGKLLCRRLKLEKLDGVFDAQSLVLKDEASGRVYRFDPAKRVLYLKQAVYRKID